jgi:ribonuclease HII
MPHLQYEQAVLAIRGSVRIAGLDEAGRGAIAGPVFAGAVILPLELPNLYEQMSEVNDSKQLPARRREQLFDRIVEIAIASGVGSSSASEIDDIGIVSATHLAMLRALQQLPFAPEHLLIDGRIRLRSLNLRQQAIVRGDSASLSIAAASILAKVSRDREMRAWHELYPHYGFDHHKGYCTREHEVALAMHGPCAIHRRSFAPIRPTLL